MPRQRLKLSNESDSPRLPLLMRYRVGSYESIRLKDRSHFRTALRRPRPSVFLRPARGDPQKSSAWTEKPRTRTGCEQSRPFQRLSLSQRETDQQDGIPQGDSVRDTPPRGCGLSRNAPESSVILYSRGMLRVLDGVVAYSSGSITIFYHKLAATGRESMRRAYVIDRYQHHYPKICSRCGMKWLTEPRMFSTRYCAIQI
jgi:hypothetical protein